MFPLANCSQVECCYASNGLLWTPNNCLCSFCVNSLVQLARIQVFRREASMKGGALVGRSGDILPRKILKLQFLGNAILSILRRSQHVLISHFFKLECHSLMFCIFNIKFFYKFLTSASFRGFDRTPKLTIRGIDQILMVYVRVSSCRSFVYRKLRQTPENPPKTTK